MHVGIAHHFGWAVAVTASDHHQVVDRRRIELVEPGTAVAPIHSDGARLDDVAVAALVAEVRASAERATSTAFDELAAEVPGEIASLSLRWWPDDFPRDLPTLRRAPYEARADSVMYREVLADQARARGWSVHLFDAGDVESLALAALGERSDDVLRAPRSVLGPPWGKDQRIAFAAAILAGTA